MGRRSTYRKDPFALRDPSTWRGAPRLPAGLALVAMCLLGMVALPNWSASQSGRLHEEIRGTLTPLEVTLERLHREVLDLANDLRGYLLTSDPVFLVSVDVQRRRIEADLARAGAFAARAEPALADGLGRARAAYEDWLVHSRVAMSLGRQGDLPRARERALSAASLR
ncbi:MAG: CHASE3 domain-containing protein, partial [Gemmatimonadota bacterium]